MTCKHLKILSGNNQPIVWGCEANEHDGLRESSSVVETICKGNHENEICPKFSLFVKQEITDEYPELADTLGKQKLSYRSICKTIKKLRRDSWIRGASYQYALDDIEQALRKKIERKMEEQE